MAVFHFRQFDVDDEGCGMKICSDSVLLGAWLAPEYSLAKAVADVGAGSGVLALICAQCCPQAQVTALEIDSAAAAAARANFARSPWSGRLALVEGDFAAAGGIYDLIISNPPYFTTGELAPDPTRALARHKGSLGYATLAQWAPRHLGPEGHLGFVSPADDEQAILFDAELAGLRLRRLARIATSPRKAPTRLLWDFALKSGPEKHSCLSIRDGDGRISAEYRALVEPFYTKI